jgi:hypothetical protein
MSNLKRYNSTSSTNFDNLTSQTYQASEVRTIFVRNLLFIGLYKTRMNFML